MSAANSKKNYKYALLDSKPSKIVIWEGAIIDIRQWKCSITGEDYRKSYHKLLFGVAKQIDILGSMQYT